MGTFMRILRIAAACLAALPTLVQAQHDDASALVEQGWEAVEAEARGGEVNWFLWGGADTINRYVSEWVGGRMKERYDVTVNRIGLSDTVEAVNQVLNEKQAGVHEGGAVDLIWINGENFRTLKQGGMAFCGYTEIMPNNRLINWSDDSVARDFGEPVEGCETPWGRAAFAFAHDAARTPEPPRSVAALIEWVKANPGRFTYPAPPDFNGSVFVRHVFYHAAGGVEAIPAAFDQAAFDRIAGRTWEILNAMETDLWRQGETYPTSIAAMAQLFANREIDLFFNYEPSIFGVNVENGMFPETTRSYGLKDGAIANTNYVAIPYNSPNKAAAMVLANFLISPEAQLEKAKPEVWGAPPAIDLSRLTDAERAGFDALSRHPSVVTTDELADVARPELSADWIQAIEAGWRENVGR